MNFLLWLTLILSWNFSYASKAETSIKSKATPLKPFYNLSKSPEELVQRAITALNKSDTVGFYALCITRKEYQILYPYLDNIDTSNAEDMSFRMGFLLMDNRKMILRKFTNYGKKQLKFSRIALLEKRDDRKRFFFQPGFHAWVKSDSTEFEIPLAKTLVLVNGGWKFWGISDD